MGASALGWPARCPAASRRPLPTHRITRVSSGRMGTAQQQQRGPGPAYPACCQEPHGQRVSVRAKTWPRCSGGGQPALGDGRLCTHLPFEEGQGQAGGGMEDPAHSCPRVAWMRVDRQAEQAGDRRPRGLKQSTATQAQVGGRTTSTQGWGSGEGAAGRGQEAAKGGGCSPDGEQAGGGGL